MSVYVRETAAGKAVSVWIIFKGSREVASVLAHFGTSRVLVNVFQSDRSADRSAKKHKTNKSRLSFQHASAGGYGYDKLTAALSGLWIDGHQLTDHCQGSKRPPHNAEVFPADYKPPKGWHFANYKTKKHHAAKREGYSNCYREPGLKYLEAIGYRVIQAI